MGISKIQLVVYYQWCVLIGWATTGLYVKAPYSSEKRQLLGGKKGLKSSFNKLKLLCRDIFDQLVGFY